jgi:hypothetical protein
MKGVDEAGVRLDVRRAEGHDAGGVLRGLDVATVRRFLIDVMKRGGVPAETMQKVMGCSRATLYRYAKAADPSE